MGNKQAPGNGPTQPGLILSESRKLNLVATPKQGESSESKMTKVSDQYQSKPRIETGVFDGCLLVKDQLAIVNITKKTENQYLVEMADGSKYLGGLHQSQFNGYGEVEWNSFKKRYRGQWTANLPHGFGVEDTDEYTYEGNFNLGLKEGHGKICFTSGERFLGNFSNNKFNGFGVYRWTDNTEYRGNFKDGLFDGVGSLITYNENEGNTTLKALWRQGEIYDYSQCSFG